MNKRFHFIVSLSLLACMALPLAAMAQSKPRWAQKGVKALNKERSNDTYEFVCTEDFGADINTMRRERLRPLVEKIAAKYSLPAQTAKIDTLYAADGTEGAEDYRITFTSDSEAVFRVRVVDEHEAFEDYADQTYDWTIYRLYAVSGKNVTPLYDNYSLTRTYNAAGTALSLIPGMGQIHKGQTAKGFVIMGSEAALIGGIIYFTAKQHKYSRKADSDTENTDSWKSKARSWKQIRNISAWLAGGLYVYNLIDAAVSKGARMVVVNKRKDTEMAVLPLVTTEGAGLSVALRF